MVRGLAQFALSRVIIGISALLVSSFVVFGGLYLAPGSPTDFLLGNRPASPELVAQVREQYRLDEPFLTQYGLWLRDAGHGDFGASAIQHRSVGSMLADGIPITLQIVGMSLILVVVVGMILGAVAAYRGGLADDVVVASTSVLSATPAFVAALILVFFFGVELGWLPVFGPGESGSDRVVHLLLPSIALALAWIPLVTQTVRSALAKQLGSEYVETAKARGLGSGRIFWRHVLPNAQRPILTALGLAVTGLLASSALVEVVFQLPGVGAMLISSVTSRDFPVVQGACLFLVSAFVVVNIAVEFATRLLDSPDVVSGVKA